MKKRTLAHLMPLSRRAFVKGAVVTGTAALAAAALRAKQGTANAQAATPPPAHYGHGNNIAMGEVKTDDFDPYRYLTDFSWGDRVTPLPDGTSLREYTLVAEDKAIEIVPGVNFAAWALNGQVPGPTIRAKEGDRLRIRFINNGTHPHTLHFHGFHSALMDGVPPALVSPGGSEFTYEFVARPYGVHLYHCHATPLKRHIHKGLYGAFIVDPKEGWGREAENEFVFMMNAFDTNFDDENEVYAVNTKAFAYANRPIRITKGKLQRAFLVNITEFDPLNSLHLHANFFRYWENGHKYEREDEYDAPANAARYTDNVALTQGERGLVEFRYHELGRFMFHAHQSEFVELGWMGLFDVIE